MKNNCLKTLITVCCLSACGGTLAADAARTDGLTINVGTEYSSGKYGGTDRNTVLSIPVSAKYTTGRFILRLSVPWLEISGTGVVTSGIGGFGSTEIRSSNSGHGSVNSGGSSGSSNSGKGKATNVSSSGGTFGATRTTEHGFGDIVAGLTYNAVDTGGLLLDVTGKVKFPTGSESRGLSNGQTDYALLVDAEQAIGKGFINGGIGHKWLGEPAGVSLRNPWFSSVGGGYKLTTSTTMGVSYDYSQSSRSGGTAAQEVSVYASQRFTRNIKLNGNVYKGLSNGSPDWGAGVSLGYTF
jgi:hypothetical protein